MRQGNHRVSRWLFGHNARPPRLVRLAFFGVGLVVLGATYAATDSEGLQLLALFVLIFGVLPALDRRFGAVDDYTKAVQERNVPFSVVALSLALGIAWAALVLIVVPELGLGPAFWLWVVMWPWIEVVAFLGERRLRRDGGHTRGSPRDRCVTRRSRGLRQRRASSRSRSCRTSMCARPSQRRSHVRSAFSVSAACSRG